MREILCLTTYPPRQCGIATFSDDLIRSIHQKFGQSYSVKVCAVESSSEQHTYNSIVKYKLNTSEKSEFQSLADTINQDSEIDLILIQHEFGLFKENQAAFLTMLGRIKKPVLVVFHTVLSKPETVFRNYVRSIASSCPMIVVMTQTSSQILQQEYGIDARHITVIQHGTHLVSHQDKKKLKKRYNLSGRRVLSTFGLLGDGKSIETTLDALPSIVRKNPTVLFLIIGKTHPSIVKTEGETYRQILENKIVALNLSEHVRFVNEYLDLPTLLEYLQLTDVYLFTSCDPNQAVSGTFVYALSCGCPIIATPIPHALELLSDRSGLIFDFKNSEQLAIATNRLLANEGSRAKMRIAGLQKIMATAWENSAIAHTLLFDQTIGSQDSLHYSLPPINTAHIRRMSNHFGIIQFSKGNRPDLETGYTIDDNARALTATCEAFNVTGEIALKKYIRNCLDFITFCQQPDGSFLNYVDSDRQFTGQNDEVLLDDSNGRTIYSLGHFVAHGAALPKQWTLDAQAMILRALPRLHTIYSPRSIAFILKGLCDYSLNYPSDETSALIKLLADRLVEYYKKQAGPEWHWFEASLTYDNSVLPESLLYAYRTIGEPRYKEVAKESFDFLLGLIFNHEGIHVVSNDGWLLKGEERKRYGEQPIDVASAVMVLTTFYDEFSEAKYLALRTHAFNWFLGDNHLHQIIYNPATGGCYDGLEEHNVNLNQGAESTVCYLLARLAMEKKFAHSVVEFWISPTAGRSENPPNTTPSSISSIPSD